jgi:hypothetical protein
MKVQLWSFVLKSIRLSIWLIALQGCAYGQPSDDGIVCVTSTGKKYHACSCRYLKYSSTEIKRTEATKLGYAACLVCKPGDTTRETKPVIIPPNSVTNTTEVKKPDSNKKSASSQCTAYTKAGTRCKRTASATTEKCWQHQ